uniref:Helicase ATP-binding domain-containing protein n=1 Tax=Timema monikensis TaxID=170555 RepID=A0A7R9HJ16_9NEOP|nr:unnamed protein product [Timema monikensis]
MQNPDAQAKALIGQESAPKPPPPTERPQCENQEEKLFVPEEFPFPFTPYSIQKDFMKSLYSALEEGKLVQSQLSKIKLRDEKLETLKRNHVSKNQEKQFQKHSSSVKNDLSEETSSNEPYEDIDIILEDGDVETNDGFDSDKEQEEDEESLGTKIFFCSRTHSQLSQFVGEVQRSPYGRDIRLVSLASRQNYCINKSVQKLKSVTLVNERCLDLQRAKKSRPTACDVDGKTVKKSKCLTGCPYFQSRAVERLRDDVLTEVQDVEQLVAKGQHLSACPYYGSRAAIKDAQVVVVPYNTLLHKSTREACGINLRGNVLIIDEAHNLLDTISHIHSSELTGHQLTHSHSQLTQYRDRFHSRFGATTLLHLNQVIFIIGGKPGCNPIESSRKGVDTKLYTLTDFVLSAEIDNLNIYKLLRFCQKSKIAQKLRGYTERYQPSVNLNPPSTVQKKETGIRAFLKEISSKNNINTLPNEQDSAYPAYTETISANPLLSVLSFLESLTNHSEDGRIVCSRQTTVGKGSVKFLLLNPAAHFSDVVKEARSVIVAGGTMQPLEEFKEQLFLSAGADSSRIVEFSCGHVIPPENILPMAVTVGPSGKQLDFSYQARNTLAMLNELGRLLINVCNIVPAGIVCFFPSYEYEKLVFQHLERSGVIAKVALKKKIFREPKKASNVDEVLSEYSTTINGSKCTQDKNSCNGALLFSVVGGKLSEGLNFSDDLGRCVILVGLPYPNMKSPELQEKINYLNTKKPGSGKLHYENLCMKAVNQSIGRAVRHKDDYSTVLLLDQRYSQPHIQAALPSWIRPSVQTQVKFGPMLGQLVKRAVTLVTIVVAAPSFAAATH